jgi:AbrB family looped-hinge helix DNA binding protein
MDKGCSIEKIFHGSVTVGERGQIVIPAEARKKFEIETGDKLLVFSYPNKAGLMLAKVDAVEDIMRLFSDALHEMKETLEK